MIPLGPPDRVAIKSAGNTILPKGKTPRGAAVVVAAEELKYTEEGVTVILVMMDSILTSHVTPIRIYKVISSERSLSFREMETVISVGSCLSRS